MCRMVGKYEHSEKLFLDYTLGWVSGNVQHLQHGLFEVLGMSARLRVELLDDGRLGARQHHRVHKVVEVHHHPAIVSTR